MQWFVDAFYKYAVFSGRSSRAAYWWFVVFALLFYVVFSIGDTIFDMVWMVDLNTILPAHYQEVLRQVLQKAKATELLETPLAIGLLANVYILILLLPASAILIRRFHDVGRSAWWFLLVLVPIIGQIVPFIFTLLDSQPGTNKYGPNPKGL